MAEYRYYLIPDAMTRAFPEQFGKQTPTEFFDNIADLEKRYHQLREMPYNCLLYTSLLPELHEVEAQRQKEQVQDEPER